MSFPLKAIKQLVLPIRQKNCGVIRNVRVMCEERSISPYALHCGTCGEKISAVRKTEVENHGVYGKALGVTDLEVSQVKCWQCLAHKLLG